MISKVLCVVVLSSPSPFVWSSSLTARKRERGRGERVVQAAVCVWCQGRREEVPMRMGCGDRETGRLWGSWGEEGTARYTKHSNSF